MSERGPAPGRAHGAAVAMGLFGAAAAVFQLSSYDIWWHLATGRWILARREIPHVEVFSHTAPGHEYIDHEWLFQVLAYLLHGLGGSAALVLGKALLVGLTVFVVWRFAARQLPLAPAAAAFLAIPFVLAGRDRYLVRPEAFTLLFAALLLAAVLERPAQLSWRRLWWIPPLCALWANLHAGLILGLLLLGAVAAGLVLEGLPVVGRADRDASRAGWRLAAVLAAGTAAGLLNPFGHLVYATPFRLTALIHSGLFDNFEWRRPSFENQWLFYLVLLACVAAALMKLGGRHWSALLPLALLAYLSLRYVRNIAAFSLLAPMLLARLYAALPVAGDGPPRGSMLHGLRPRLVAGILGLLALWLLLGSYRFPAGLDFDHRRFPVAGVEAIARLRPAGQLFNAYGFGGYVAWRLGPATTIFIDGRNEVFEQLRRELKESVGDSRRWRELLTRYDIGYALVSHLEQREEVRIMDADGRTAHTEWWPYTRTHFPEREWALVHWDDVSLLFVQRRPANLELIAHHEVPRLYPAHPDFQIELIRRGEAQLPTVVAALEQKLDEDPDCVRAQHLMRRLVEEFSVAEQVQRH